MYLKVGETPSLIKRGIPVPKRCQEIMQIKIWGVAVAVPLIL